MVTSLDSRVFRHFTLRRASRDPDLYAWYKFDDGSCVDHGTCGHARTSVFPHIGVLVAAPTFAAGRVIDPDTQKNGALRFDGSTQSIDLTNGESFIFAPATTSPFTVACWCILESGSGNFPLLFGNNNAAGAAGFYFGIGIGTNPPNTGMNLFWAGVETNSTTFPVGSNHGIWMHCACTGSGGATQTLNVYVNGVLAGTGSGTPTGVVSPSHIGIANGAASGNSDWKGTIDDLKVYQRTLTPGEIFELYASAFMPVEPEMMAIFPSGNKTLIFQNTIINTRNLMVGY